MIKQSPCILYTDTVNTIKMSQFHHNTRKITKIYYQGILKYILILVFFHSFHLVALNFYWDKSCFDTFVQESSFYSVNIIIIMSYANYGKFGKIDQK